MKANHLSSDYESSPKIPRLNGFEIDFGSAYGSVVEASLFSGSVNLPACENMYQDSCNFHYDLRFREYNHVQKVSYMLPINQLL